MITDNHIETGRRNGIGMENKVKKVGSAAETVFGVSGETQPVALWTWLIKDIRSQQFYKGEGVGLDIDVYMRRVQEKIDENQVPARIEQTKVQWDGGDIIQEVFMIQPETRIRNPLPCLLHFSHIGKFTFVEEKTFIIPPSLQADLTEPTARRQIWKEWYRNVFLHAFQEELNGHLGRIFDAAFSCIRQVNEELFAGGSIKDMDERGDINRMEELVMRRLEWE